MAKRKPLAQFETWAARDNDSVGFISFGESLWLGRRGWWVNGEEDCAPRFCPRGLRQLVGSLLGLRKGQRKRVRITIEEVES